MKCIACGKANPEDALFCAHCGAKMIAQPEAPDAQEAAVFAARPDARPLKENPVRPHRPEESAYLSGGGADELSLSRAARKAARMQEEEEALAQAIARRRAEHDRVDAPERRKVVRRVSAGDLNHAAPEGRRVIGEHEEIEEMEDTIRLDKPLVPPVADEFEDEPRPRVKAIKIPRGRGEEETDEFEDTPRPRVKAIKMPRGREEEEPNEFEDTPRPRVKAVKIPRGRGEEEADEFEDAPVRNSRVMRQESAREDRMDRIPPEHRAYARRPEEDEAEEPPRRRPMPAARPSKKQVFLFDDEKDEEDEDEELYDEDEDDERGGGRRFWRLIPVVAVLLLLVAGTWFFFASDTGRRFRASMGISSSASDYMLLATYQEAQSNNASAESAYYDAFRCNQSDYDFCLTVAAGFERVGANTRAQQLYLYLIKMTPERNEAYDNLLVLFNRQGMTQEYNALLQYRAANQGTQAGNGAYPAQTTPAPVDNNASLAAPTGSLPSGSYNQSVQLALTAQEGAQIHVTQDGSQPGANSPAYTGIIVLDAGTWTVRAVAVKDGMVSPEWQGTYTVNQAQ